MPVSPLVPLINAAGFLTGIALYAMLGWMLLRDRRAREVDRLLVSAAVLGVVWNVGALLYYGPASGTLLPSAPWIGALAFSGLGFLPATVVAVAARPLDRRYRISVLVLAYGISAIAGALQFLSATTGDSPARDGLLLLTVGYAGILVAMTFLLWRAAGHRGMLTATGLAVFAVMALHLSQHSEGRDGVLTELLGHQGALPLAVVILYQDYRFAFADLFLKRALALVTSVSLAIVVYAQIVAPLIAHFSGTGTPTESAGVVVTFAVMIALVHPLLQRWLYRFVDRVVLQRPDYAAARLSLGRTLERAGSESDAVHVLHQALRQPFGAQSVKVTPDDAPERDGAMTRSDGVRVVVPIVCVDRPDYRITVDALPGGRRLLSDDLQFLEGAALLAARRIDALRAERVRLQQVAAELEVRRLVSEAELRALRAQLDPHFLFNALTTIGHLLMESPSRARGTLLELTGLLRRVLRPGAHELVTLAEELDIITSYLAIEHARFEDRLRYRIDVAPALHALRVPPLLLQPLVENAVKHGIAPLRRGGVVTVTANVESRDDGPLLLLTVNDTGAGVSASELSARRQRGVGLRNVEQRLVHQFSGAAGISFTSTEGHGTTVRLWIPVTITTSAGEVAA